jgi:hypothetical protein
MKLEHVASAVCILLTWTLSPPVKRYVTMELSNTTKNSRWSFALLHSTLGTVLGWLAQLSMSESVLDGWKQLGPRPMVMALSVASITMVCGFLLTLLLTEYNPGHTMAGLNAMAVFSTFMVGTALYGQVTRNGAAGAFLMALGAFLILDEKART